jgi:hypothetical protein
LAKVLGKFPQLHPWKNWSVTRKPPRIFIQESTGKFEGKGKQYLSLGLQKASIVTSEFRLFLKELGKIRGSIGVKS